MKEAIVPLYKILNSEPIQDSINKDELLQRGWTKGSDGKWVKTGPDVPPHRRGKE